MKRVLFRSIILVSLVLLIACSDQENTSTNQKDDDSNTNNNELDNADDNEVTIVFGSGKDETGATDSLIKAFEEEHENIKVEVREFPNNSDQQHDQYVTIFSSESSEIDVINMDVIWPAEFSEAGYLLSLDRFIEDDELDVENYLAGGMDAGNYNLQQWALPRYLNSGLLYYRSDIVETPPETWDELIEMSTELQGEKDTKFGYIMQALQYEGLVANFNEFIESYGGKIIDEDNNIIINSPETIKGLEKMIEIVNSDIVPSNVTTFNEPETISEYAQGSSVFARQWPAMYANLQKEDESNVIGKVDVSPLPAGDSGSRATLGGWLGGISKFSEHPREAWEFLKFITGPEGQKIMAVEATQTPTYLPLFDDEEVQKASPLFANKDFVEGLKSASPRPVTPKYAEVSDVIQIEVSRALAEEITAEEAISNMEEKLIDIVND